MKLNHAADVQLAEEDLASKISEAVASHAAGDDRIVVRPDGAIMVGKWIVASFAGGNGADPPSGEEFRTDESLRGLAASRDVRDSGVKAMPGVGRFDAAWLLPAVERQRIGGDLLAPERFFEV